MIKLQALKELHDKVEAGDNEFIRSDDMIFAWEVACPEMESELLKSNGRTATTLSWSACDGSLDAAKALHNAVLPKWGWSLNANVGVGRQLGQDCVVDAINPYRCYGACYGANDDTMARAWLIAILKALIAQEEAQA